MHCSLIMHGFHNGKWLILCSKYIYIYVETYGTLQAMISETWYGILDSVDKVKGF